MKNSIFYLKSLLKTDGAIIPLILRIGLGSVILAHGLQKLLGMFGGHGPEWTVNMWSQWWGIPAFITWLVILGESLGMVALILGFFTRIFAVVTIIIMTGAIILVHHSQGFFMNWYSEPRAEGIEYHILVYTLALALLLLGGGKYSLDNIIFKKLSKKNE